ncbi:MAG: hypothetical protein AAF990_01195 [Bacteroidota bacterium]
MKVLTFGGSGSGTTTLANALANTLGWKHLEADDYYWRKTDPPYQEKIPLEERNAALWADYEAHEGVIISGSPVTWGDHWLGAFDLAVFLWIPPALRMKRLAAREHERYGDRLQTDEQIQANSKDFLDWARQYDDPSFDGKSITQHENWMKRLHCPVLRLEGDLSVEERVQQVREKIAVLTVTSQSKSGSKGKN